MISGLSHGAWIASLVALAGATLGCVGPGVGEQQTGGPPFGQNGQDFAPVSKVLERRCGTLDCHGSTFRPLRIYGQYGLRKPFRFRTDPGAPAGADFDKYYSGGGLETTSAELLDNYNSVIALEPELMQEVITNEEKTSVDARGGLPCPYTPREDDVAATKFMTVDCLTLVRKPRLQEKHKGGKIWERGNSPGDQCLIGWIQAAFTGKGDYKDACVNEFVVNR